jgi:protein phosphatase 1 regulatory subunit 7
MDGERDSCCHTEEAATTFRLGEDLDLPHEPNAQQFEVHYTRLERIENLGKFRDLRKLVFIATGLHEIENLEDNHLLEHLEIYQGNLHCIKGLSHLHHLRFLDLSFNRIRKIEGLRGIVDLEKLYLSSNMISVIEGIDTMSKLKVLELGSNQIDSLAGLENLESLEELWLGRNKIKSMNMPRRFDNLKILSLQSNRLLEWCDLQQTPVLEQLYLSGNALPDISVDVLHSLPCTMLCLDIASNRLTIVPRFNLPDLTELWLNDNLIADFESLDNLAFAPNLQTVYLERNLVQSQVPLEYTKRMRKVCPKLQQLDAVPIISLNIALMNRNTDVARSILKRS